jgi:hypothetical protein
LIKGIRLHSAGRGSACMPNPSNPPREVRRDFASLQKIKPLQGAVIFLRTHFIKGIRLHSAGRGSACMPNPSNPPREVRRDFASLQKIKPLEGAVIFLADEFYFWGFSRRLACMLVASNPILFTKLFLNLLDEGFAYILQAAVRLTSRTLRIPHAKSAGTSLLSKK